MSDFWVKKIKTYFKRIDFDGDGAVTRKDFEGMADRFVQREKLDTTRGGELKSKLIQVWDNYLKGVVADGKPLTESVFVDTLKHKIGDEAFKKTLAGPLPLFFSAVDANADGQIQADEYQLFFDIFGVDPKLAPASFAAIDTNHDGSLSLDEFVTAGVEFFTSQDESSPSKFFWGPLV